MAYVNEDLDPRLGFSPNVQNKKRQSPGQVSTPVEAAPAAAAEPAPNTGAAFGVFPQMQPTRSGTSAQPPAQPAGFTSDTAGAFRDAVDQVRNAPDAASAIGQGARGFGATVIGGLSDLGSAYGKLTAPIRDRVGGFIRGAGNAIATAFTGDNAPAFSADAPVNVAAAQPAPAAAPAVPPQVAARPVGFSPARDSQTASVALGAVQPGSSTSAPESSAPGVGFHGAPTDTGGGTIVKESLGPDGKIVKRTQWGGAGGRPMGELGATGFGVRTEDGRVMSDADYAKTQAAAATGNDPVARQMDYVKQIAAMAGPGRYGFNTRFANLLQASGAGNIGGVQERGNASAAQLAQNAPLTKAQAGEAQARADAQTAVNQARSAHAAALNSGDEKQIATAETNLRALQGKWEKEYPDLFTANTVPGGMDPTTGMPRPSSVIITNKRDGTFKVVSPDEARGAAPASKYEAGKVYVDAKGNRAKWDGKQFVSP